MKIMIATPAFGGQVTAAYCGSLFAAGQFFSGHKVSLQLLSNESLIPRARNKLAYLAIKKEQDILFFVDADLSFTVQEMSSLITSEQNIIGGTYSAKQLPPRLVHRELSGEVPNSKGEVKVKYLPTGFMRIKVSLLQELKPYATPFRAQDPETGEDVIMHDFFRTGVRDGIYESEDYGFCSLVQEAGHSVFLNTKVILPHIGSHTFRTS